MISIYYLYNLEDTEKIPKYIGKTKSNLNYRLYHHLWGTRVNRYNTICSKWIRSINFKVGIELIEECEDDIWEEREKFYISKYRGLYKIYNQSDGGFGGCGLFSHSNPNSVCVAQYSLKGDLIKTFKSIVEAEKFTEIKASKISNCVSMERVKSAQNYQWIKFKEGEIPLLKINSYKPNFTHHPKTAKQVGKYIDGKLIEKYSSISEAAFINKINYSNMKFMVKKEHLYKKHIQYKRIF